MSSSNPTSPRGSDIRQLYADFLADIERVNFEGKRFYNPLEVRTWMLEKRNPGDLPNGVLLLVAVYPQRGFDQVKFDQIRDSLLVFATLAHPEVSCGERIHEFRRYQIRDEQVFSELISYEHLESLGLDKVVISKFDKLRWSFFPARIRLGMDQNITAGRTILPFCRKDPINEKGGTANVVSFEIQEPLVPEDLRKKIALSRHRVENFDWCYTIVVKSYIPGWEDTYDIESEAFRGIGNLDGVVQFIGEYHSLEPVTANGGKAGMTHHILLEYGEQDLDEWLVEEYPPVLNEEIIRVWEEVFSVATTIKELHHPDIEGKDIRGWHGDIKPDNLLRINGKLRLADFGFAHWEFDRNNMETFMVGGTSTYGAPECDWKARGGTMTPHTQKIDTWSFGCVLSAVATWIVLGSQAYDKHFVAARTNNIMELRRRRETNATISVPTSDDAFHDGRHVLPAVSHWHDYLRNSARRADTITYRVLDLVDDKMLRASPSMRDDFESLVEKLNGIVVLARREYQKSIRDSRLPAIKQDTLELLLSMDDKAPQKATIAKDAVVAKPSGKLTAAPASGLAPETLHPNPSANRLAAPVTRVRKSERLDKIYIGKVAGRAQAIHSLAKPTEQAPQTPTPVPGPELVDSPPPMDLDGRAPRTNSSPLGPIPERMGSVKGKGKAPDVPNDYQYYMGNHSQPVPLVPTVQVQEPEEMEDERASAPPESTREPAPITQDETRPRPESMYAGGSRPVSGEFGPPSGLPAPPPTFLPHSTAPPFVSTPAGAYYGPFTSAPSSPPADASQAALGPGFQSPPPNAFNIQQSIQQGIVAILWPPPISEEYNKQVGLWKGKGVWGDAFRNVPVTPELKNFIVNRDIIFIVDNGPEMAQYWHLATTIVSTLSMMIGPLDKDGLDVKFTRDHDYNLSNVKQFGIRDKIPQAMIKAYPTASRYGGTNMEKILGEIFDANNPKTMRKKLTLIIVTDGIWSGTSSVVEVEKLIARYQRKVQELGKLEGRRFSIGFVAIGADMAGLKKLKDLDDDMKEKYQIQDVIDTVPWFGDPQKMIIGSMSGAIDDADDNWISMAQCTLTRTDTGKTGTSGKFSLKEIGRRFK